MFTLTKNVYNFIPTDLFVIGKRAGNKKRNFLFISKLLGKHLPVNPDVVKATGFLLSSLKYKFENSSFVNCLKTGEIPDFSNHAKDNVLVIGFCETATGLGMSVAASIEGCTYQTTTREPINDIKKLLTFEEEHSHATTHNMFSNIVNLNDFEKVILVDDEITTGNSLLNLIKELHKNSNIKEYNIMTILDWRSTEQRKKYDEFSSKNNVVINVYSLVEGYIEPTIGEFYENEQTVLNTTTIPCYGQLDSITRFTTRSNFENVAYFRNSGRFGVTYEYISKTEEECKNAASKLYNRIKEQRILVLGHGENIYIPSRVAAHLKEMGKDVSFKTTSLSPIYCDGNIIEDQTIFLNRGNLYHFYNVKQAEEDYDIVILLTETPVKTKICENIRIYNL